MKQFTVKLPMIATLHDEVVERSVIVQADYFRIECGVVTFRRLPRSNEQYPQAVRVFAPGFWAEIIEGQEVVNLKQPCGRMNADLDHVARRMSMLDFPEQPTIEAIYDKSILGNDDIWMR